MEEIERNNIRIYALPDCDSDEDDFYKEKVSASNQNSMLLSEFRDEWWLMTVSFFR